MRIMMRKFLAMSPGELGLMLSYGVVAFYGLAFGITVVMMADGEALLTRSLTAHEIWTVVVGGTGMMVGLWMTQDRIGCATRLHTLSSMIVLTLIGSIVAGTLALPGYGTMFAPMAWIIMIFTSPTMLGLWLLSMAGAHRWVGQWHVERDSIFGPQALPSLIPAPILMIWHRARS